MQFGTSMLRAGNTAIRTRECMDVMARKMDLDVVAVSLSLDGITATVRGSGHCATVMRGIGPPGSMPGVLESWSSLQERQVPALRPMKSQPG